MQIIVNNGAVEETNPRMVPVDFSAFNKIKRICKFASRFCKFSCALQGVLRIIKLSGGKIVAKNIRNISLHDLPKK